MYKEIPQYCLRAYAYFFSHFGVNHSFGHSELEWTVSRQMGKKIFSVLLNSGWIRRAKRDQYYCSNPADIFLHLLDFRVPAVMKTAKRSYCFFGLSAIEIWSDYSYVQRDMKRSPYFIRVLKSDLGYWKKFFAENEVPAYIGHGSTIGEFAILEAVDHFDKIEHGGLFVEPLRAAMEEAKENELFSYAFDYMGEKYGTAANSRS